MRLKTIADEMFADLRPGPRISASDPLPPENRTSAFRTSAKFDTLYRAQAPQLLRFFSRRVGREEASDLVHEAFASLLGAVTRQARHIERPEAYLSTIARNLVGKRARTAVRRSAALHVPADDVPLTGADPQAQLEARDMLHRLETAMLRLRPTTRQIFMAHRLDGYTYREIAERTGLTLKRVEKHMSRAIAQLDDVLGAGR